MAIDKFEADPKKPYKAYAAAIAALLGALLVQYGDAIPPVGKIIIAILINAIGVYVTPNPAQFRHKK